MSTDAAPILTEVFDDVAPDGAGQTSSYTGYWLINDTTPVLRVDLAGADAAAGDTLTLASRQPTVASFSHVVTAAEAQAGYVDLTPTLAEGWYQFQSSLAHADGASTGLSVVRAVRVDTTAPAAPQIAAVHDDQGAQTGDLQPGQTTDDATPTVTVAFDTEQPPASGAPPGHNPYPDSSTIGGTVQVFADGMLVGSGAAGPGSTTLTLSALSAGTHDLTARLIDTAGNVGAASSAFQLTVSDDAASEPGQVLTAHTAPDTLAGGAGADTLVASQGADQLTGGAGADAFVFQDTPWNAGHITDFAVGLDKLDLSALLHASGYAGSDPVADGYISLASDGAGGTEVLYDTDGRGGDNTIQFRITDLDHVSPAGLTWGQLSGGAEASPPSDGGAGGGPTETGSDTAGQALTAQRSPDTLAGSEGNDTITASQGHDLLSGGGGADLFVFKALPWNAGEITDFTVGSDHLDLSALFQASGYAGSDPVADGYISLTSDGAGGTEVLYDTDGTAAGSTIQYRIVDLGHVAPDGLSWAQLAGAAGGSASPPASVGTGGASSPPAGGDGQVLTSQQAGDTLTGGAGADTLNASQGPDQLTGGDGADHFAWNALPWNAGHITDFAPGADVLDLRALFAAASYAGADPVADHWLEFRSDGAGDTQVYFDSDGPAGAAWPTLITTLDHVAPTQLGGGDFLFH